MGILSKFFNTSNTSNTSTKTEKNSLDTQSMTPNFTDLTVGIQNIQLFNPPRTANCHNYLSLLEKTYKDKMEYSVQVFKSIFPMFIYDESDRVHLWVGFRDAQLHPDAKILGDIKMNYGFRDCLDSPPEVLCGAPRFTLAIRDTVSPSIKQTILASIKVLETMGASDITSKTEGCHTVYKGIITNLGKGGVCQE